MNTQRKSSDLSDQLDTDLMYQLFDLSPSATPSPEASARIAQKLMQRVSAQSQFFVFADLGEWKPLGPGMNVKLLHKDKLSRSFLIKMAENTAIPYHEHHKNEETFVVQGEVWLDGVRCTDGDYHFASAGSFHKEVRTERGCTLLVKSYQ